MKKLIAFDLDGTLTQHRTELENENKKVLDILTKKYEIIMVSAGDCYRIYTQMKRYPVTVIGNYGMQRSIIEDGEFKLIKQKKYEVDKDFFIKQCEYLRKKYGYTEYKGESVEFHESGIVTFALLGTKADIKDKIAFDPDRSKRKVLYPEVKEIFKDYTVYIGGSSSFDFSKKEYDKYVALTEYAIEKGYKKEEVLFVGDDFGDGGGDSPIRLGGIDYINITNYKDIPQKLKHLF